MERPWTYLLNPFLSITTGAYRKTKRLGDYTLAALKNAAATADAPHIFKTLLQHFSPALSSYDEAYEVWLKEKGAQADNNNTDIEAKRIVLCMELYGVLGSLMALFKTTPETTGSFFLVEALRNHEQTTFKRNVNGDETTLVFVRIFEEGEQVKLENRGNTILQAALVMEKNDTMPQAAITIGVNTQQTVDPDALGAKDSRFLIVKNMSVTEKGAYTIEVL